MNIKELRKAIKDSEHADWFNEEMTFHFHSPESGLDEAITGAVKIWEFANRQVQGYEKMGEELPDLLKESKQNFETLRDEISLLVEKYIEEDVVHHFDRSKDDIRRSFRDTPTFLFDSAEATFFNELYTEFPKSIGAAHKFLKKRNENHRIYLDEPKFNTRNELIGAFFAFRFKYGYPDALSRPEAETQTLNELRSGFQGFIGEAEEHLIEHRKALDDYLTSSKSDFGNWYEKTKQAESEFTKKANNRVQELEDLYHTKLMLEKPAEYWKQRAETLRKEGDKWLRWLLIAIGVGVAALSMVLYFISDGTLKDLFDKTGSAIRWSVVFITFVSFLFFAVRTLTRLTFSTFHLVRDAEERQQLVYVYLALQNEKGVDEKERHLVLQSIFSRSDSGLLKEDSSPTMPGAGGLMEKMINK